MLIPVLQSSHGHTMKQFMDIFSLPEMTLLSCVNDFFMKHNIDYEPVHLYKDVKVSCLVIILRSLISVLENSAYSMCNNLTSSALSFSRLLYLPEVNVCKDVKSSYMYISVNIFTCLQCAVIFQPFSAVLILALKTRRLILVAQARLQPSASVLWWLCYFRGRGGRNRRCVLPLRAAVMLVPSILCDTVAFLTDRCH